MTSPTIQFDIPDDEDTEKPKTPDAHGSAEKSTTTPATGEGSPTA